MRMIKGDFVVTGPDIDPMRFKSRREARNWCAKHHPGSPIEEVGRGGKRAEKQRPKPKRAVKPGRALGRFSLARCGGGI